MPDIPDTMQVVIFPEKNRIEMQTHPVPAPEDDQILCRTIYSGLSNGTERNQLTGGNYGRQHPNGIGYQKVAEVVAVGDRARGYRVGDVVLSGTVGKHAGYFVEAAADPDHERHLIAHVPEDVDRKEAALLGVASVSMHDVRRCGVCLGDRVLVVGAGPIGQFAAQAARAGGGDVTLANRSEGRLVSAREAGIRRTHAVPDAAAWDALREQGPFDCVVETTGRDVLDYIIGRIGVRQGLVAPNGRLALIGGRFEVNFDCNPAQFAGLNIILDAHFGRTDLLETLRLVGEGTIRVGPLLKEVAAISDAPRIYERLRDEPSSLFGTVFDWS